METVQRMIAEAESAVAHHADMCRQLTGIPDPKHIARFTPPHLRKGLANLQKQMKAEAEARLADLQSVIAVLVK
jgi:hypothetical protein